MPVIHRRSNQNQDLYSVKFVGVKVKVTVTSKACVVKRWLSTTLHRYRRIVNRSRLVVGLGVDKTATVRTVNTLQICVGRRCLILQLSRAETVPRKLRMFLRHRSNTFVGFDARDGRKVQRSNHHLEMLREPLDVTEYADDAAVEELKEAYTTIKGKRINNWNETPLSFRQIEFATVRAYFAYRLGLKNAVWNR